MAGKWLGLFRDAQPHESSRRRIFAVRHSQSPPILDSASTDSPQLCRHFYMTEMFAHRRIRLSQLAEAN